MFYLCKLRVKHLPKKKKRKKKQHKVCRSREKYSVSQIKVSISNTFKLWRNFLLVQNYVALDYFWCKQKFLAAVYSDQIYTEVN